MRINQEHHGAPQQEDFNVTNQQQETEIIQCSGALAAWAASGAVSCDYVRFLTSIDLLATEGGSAEARAAALMDKFSEAKELKHSLLVLDDVDQMCAGSDANGYSSVMIAT